jgi:uncharacterized Zn-binding protein involved in type VI secretion
MASVQRQGDINTGGGVAQAGDPTVLINGRPVVFPGVAVTPHPPCGRPRCSTCPPHCVAKTVKTTAGSVRVNGRPVIVTGDIDSCGHPRSGGSPSVNIG